MRKKRRGDDGSKSQNACQAASGAHFNGKRLCSRTHRIFGLTAALYSEITIAKGRVQQSNFNNYRMMRINEAPAIEVHLVRSGEAPGGIGEPGTSIAGSALANALFAATGVRLRPKPVPRHRQRGDTSSATIEKNALNPREARRHEGLPHRLRPARRRGE